MHTLLEIDTRLATHSDRELSLSDAVNETFVCEVLAGLFLRGAMFPDKPQRNLDVIDGTPVAQSAKERVGLTGGHG